MKVANVEVVRDRINSIRRREVCNCFMATYLFAARISEVVGKASRRDTTTARGPRGTSASLQTYQNGDVKEQAAVFRVRTAKRKGKERLIALPLNPEFEPWTQTLYDYFKECGSELVFPFTRQKLWEVSKKVFKGLIYPIDKYSVVAEKNPMKAKLVVPEHFRDLRLHGLRHVRASELVEFYGFTAIELSTYCGWTLQTGAGLSRVMARYINLNWQGYFPKLLKKRMEKGLGVKFHNGKI